MVALRKPVATVASGPLLLATCCGGYVGRALAQEHASRLHAFSIWPEHPEALVRLLRVATDMDPRAACCRSIHSERLIMCLGTRCAGLRRPLLPYVRQCFASDSTYVWQDASRQSHEVRQSEGGEQGDPLMPARSAIAQQPALAAVHAQLREGEAVFAYLDDIYVVAVASLGHGKLSPTYTRVA